MNDENQIEQVLSEINDLMRSAANCRVRGTKSAHKSHTKQSNSNKPWFSEDLELMRVNLKKTGQALLSDCNNNFLRQKFFKMKKIYKSAVITKKRQFKQNLYDKLETMSNENPKEYWQIFEKLQNYQGNNDNTDSPIDDKEWIDHYVKLLGPKVYDKNILNKIELEITRLLEQNECQELNQPITTEEIYNACKGLKKNKAVGIDQITNEMIGCALPFLYFALKRLFNSIMWVQYYPKTWKTGIIINLFKSGDIYNADNYRGLTINSCLGKIFNCILNNRLVNFLESKKVICDNQIGFKRKARTSDHIFILNTIFKKVCKTNQKLYICFVDFKKAYDSVWRKALMLKLLRTGINGRFFGVVRHMYQDCESCIRLGGLLSDKFKCETGVRQGDVMSPNLFNLYINDIPDMFVGDRDSPILDGLPVHCLMYADDLVLLSLTADGLQSKLDRIFSYCSEWSLSINVKKTKVMIISAKEVDYKNLD